jgi:hypothetical protein
MQSDIWFRPLIWMDYRLALLFTVIAPLILLVWAFVRKVEAMQRLLAIYWRVASLLAITLYLAIAPFQVGFITSLMSRILIPLSLWFWIDLNEEIEDLPGSALKLAFNAWRWAVTLYCSVGAIAQLPSWQCAFSDKFLQDPLCQAWLEVPLVYKDVFHPNTQPGFLGLIGGMGLVVYVLYLIYFVFLKLGKQGRFAVRQ